MKRAILLGLTIALVLPLTTQAERSYVWNRTDDGKLTEGRVAAPTATSFDSRFSLSPGKLNLCTAQGPARYQLELTAVEGVDLLAQESLDLASLLTPALFKANAALLAAEPGHDLTDPEDVRQLDRPTRRFADVRVEGQLGDLRLQIFGSEAGACAAGAAAGSLRRVTAAADSCSGACDCDVCVCSGTLSCCLDGCDACWFVLDEVVGACGAT